MNVPLMSPAESRDNVNPRPSLTPRQPAQIGTNGAALTDAEAKWQLNETSQEERDRDQVTHHTEPTEG